MTIGWSVPTKMEKIAKAKEAFERRFGKRMCIPATKVVAENVVRIFDPETGSWAEYNIAGWRIRRVAEHDANLST